MLWDFINSIFASKERNGKDSSDPSVLMEAPRNHVSLEELTKEELDALGAQHGIKLDRRKRKAALIEQLKENNIFHK